MPNEQDPADSTERLARALDRIAAHAARPRPEEPSAPVDVPDREIILARLDRLIAQVRAALGPTP